MLVGRRGIGGRDPANANGDRIRNGRGGMAGRPHDHAHRKRSRHKCTNPPHGGMMRPAGTWRRLVGRPSIFP